MSIRTIASDVTPTLMLVALNVSGAVEDGVNGERERTRGVGAGEQRPAALVCPLLVINVRRPYAGSSVLEGNGPTYQIQPLQRT